MAQSQNVDFLNINIDKVFEQHRVEEVQQILQKMRAEADRKREELRVTVGNRYRDLIEAADTICEMKCTAKDIIENLQKMENQMTLFKHRQLVGFRTEEQLHEKSKEALQSKKEYLSLAAQVRLLMDLPERVWNLLDVNDFGRAAQVLQFAQHLHTGLLFEASTVKNVTTWFPVVGRQWAAVSSFNDVIVKLCLNTLKKEDLEVNDAANSLCALLLLEGSTATELLHKFLQLRTEAIQSLSNGASSTMIKQQISSFIKGISGTLMTVHSLFTEGFMDSDLPQGILSAMIKSIGQPGAPFTVQLLNLPSGAILKYLPPVVAEFRPNLKTPWELLSLSDLRQICVSWYDAMRHWMHQKITDLLSVVVSVKTLSGIREVAFSALHDDPCREQWQEVVNRLLGRDVSIWNDIVRPPVLSRIQLIVGNQMESAFTTLSGAMKQRAQEIISSEADFTLWLWTELAADLPQSVAAARGTSGVYMKTRGYTPTVQQLCSLWDQKLRSLWEDLQYYQEEKNKNQVKNPVFDKFQDREEIYSVLERVTEETVQKVVHFLHNEFTGDVKAVQLVFAARISAALVTLSPHLKLCLNAGKTVESKSWIGIVDSLKSCTVGLLLRWKENTLLNFEEQLKKSLVFNSIPDALKGIPGWEEILIEEEGESGKAVQSHIRVPLNPSLPLQNCLFELCKEINGIGCHTLPKRVQSSLMEDTARYIIGAYSAYTESHGSALSQPVALQLLFDLRFVASLFLSRDCRDLTEKCRSVCECLEGRVDPFDLDVFTPHIQRNVRLSVQRLQFLFSPLLTSDRHAVLWAARSTQPSSAAPSQQPENPILVALASTTPRLLLLPIATQTTFSSSAAQKEEALHSKQQTTQAKKTPKAKREASPSNTAAASARSSAAAFFGAVSSSWSSSIFGGGGDN